jgi:hypothetical protein
MSATIVKVKAFVTSLLLGGEAVAAAYQQYNVSDGAGGHQVYNVGLTNEAFNVRQ